mgnify:CR=1 FL=1
MNELKVRKTMDDVLEPKQFDDRQSYPQKETAAMRAPDRKSTRLNSSHGYISYAVFCLKKKKQQKTKNNKNKKKNQKKKG